LAVPRVLANGIEQAYEVIGAGPPMIMLHGATSTGPEDFAAQLPLVSTAFRCYLPDARGHGGTRWDAAGGFTLDMLVGDVISFADALGLATYHLLGFSMGAMTALHVAVRIPDRIRTLVFIGTTTEREPRTSVARRLMEPGRIERDDPATAIELARRHDPVQGPDAWRRLLPAIAADVAAQPLLSPREIHQVEAPTLVVSGDRDPFCPVEHAATLARQLADGRLLIVPDCGHEVPSERAGILNEALGLFYRTTEPIARQRAARVEIEATEGGRG
jgi:pimeloyl-ACP methyl ester carboxylesterase